MTVEELRLALEDMPDDMEVYAVCDYGDITHTMQLVELGDPEVVQPVETAYSNSGLALPNEVSSPYGDEQPEVVVLCDGI